MIIPQNKNNQSMSLASYLGQIDYITKQHRSFLSSCQKIHSRVKGGRRREAAQPILQLQQQPQVINQQQNHHHYHAQPKSNQFKCRKFDHRNAKSTFQTPPHVQKCGPCRNLFKEFMQKIARYQKLAFSYSSLKAVLNLRNEKYIEVLAFLKYK